ncbi:hypothetical protein KSZ_11260 [Dictyobacter formicarum]|uniref:Uncharacterized protein n=1 Tax=Dictyobacter formicarum TaxID=2778368 RepID=A0ABQ3VAF1_9CHLR|nr:hypothetical protein KSZ_11260 [Dictyobacter formicarum]
MAISEKFKCVPAICPLHYNLSVRTLKTLSLLLSNHLHSYYYGELDVVRELCTNNAGAEEIILF